MNSNSSFGPGIGRISIATLLLAACTWLPASAAAPPPEPRATFQPYQARFGRERPVVAVVGENRGTELTDFVIPYAVLARSGAADTVAVATAAGPMTMRPALSLQPEATVAQFDTRFPQGADYVIVPAVVHRDDPVLLAWIVSQRAKGATVVSICDGALVVAHAGLLKGRQATAHWATQGVREERYPETNWLKNKRYVIDGPIVSSAGISAAIPVSLALVEAIAGPRAAAMLASSMGVTDWSDKHDSEVFRPRFGVNLRAHSATYLTNGWFHGTDRFGIHVAAGVDDLALAMTADAYSRTGRSQAFAFAASRAPTRTRAGLLLLPEQATPASNERTLPALQYGPQRPLFDQVLASIETLYGRSTARGVALAFEYTWQAK